MSSLPVATPVAVSVEQDSLMNQFAVDIFELRAQVGELLKSVNAFAVENEALKAQVKTLGKENIELRSAIIEHSERLNGPKLELESCIDSRIAYLKTELCLELEAHLKRLEVSQVASFKYDLKKYLESEVLKGIRGIKIDLYEKVEQALDGIVEEQNEDLLAKMKYLEEMVNDEVMMMKGEVMKKKLESIAPRPSRAVFSRNPESSESQVVSKPESSESHVLHTLLQAFVENCLGMKKHDGSHSDALVHWKTFMVNPNHNSMMYYCTPSTMKVILVWDVERYDRTFVRSIRDVGISNNTHTNFMLYRIIELGDASLYEYFVANYGELMLEFIKFKAYSRQSQEYSWLQHVYTNCSTCMSRLLYNYKIEEKRTSVEALMMIAEDLYAKGARFFVKEHQQVRNSLEERQKNGGPPKIIDRWLALLN